ncbi:MAG: helix-turn-helix domain-containing protein [Lachnospiraceae bacterium]|nr:helix-turn-helix domain-containing protein [Lachnospiraceae bacterium]
MSRRRSDDVIQIAEYVTIGELVRLTGVRYSTLKYYTEIGILPFEQEGCNLTRRYLRKQAVKRIEEIRELRNKGQNIDSIIETYKKGET